MRDGKGTRRLLEDYRLKLRAVRAQEEFVRTIRKDIASLPSALSVGAGTKGTSSRPAEGVCLRLETEEEELERMKTVLQWRESVVRSYIGMADPFLQIIMRERYLHCRSWKSIAARYGGGASESSLRMAVVRHTDRNPINWII